MIGTKINRGVFTITFISLFAYFAAISCKDDDTKFEFGAALTGLKADTVYQAQSDGLLTVKYKNNTIGNDYYVKILSDENADPKTEIGGMYFGSTTTLPIYSENYWKVIHGTNSAKTIEISFIPFIGK